MNCKETIIEQLLGKILRIDPKSVRTAKGKLKKPRYAYTLITDSVLNNLFNVDRDTHKETYDSLFGEDGSIPFASVKNKTKAVARFDKSKEPFGSVIGKFKNEDDARYISIAVSHLESAMKSQEDAISKYGLNTKAAEAVKDAGNEGKAQESYYNMAHIIGRDIMKSYGNEFNPKTAEDFDALTMLYMSVGVAALERLEEIEVSPGKPLISVNDSGSIVNRRFMSDNGKGDMYSSNKKGDWHTPTIDGVKTISLRPYIDPKLELSDQIDISSTIAAVTKLVLPVEVDIPSQQAYEHIRKSDIGLSSEFHNTAEIVQDNPLQIDPEMEEALQDLYERINKDSDPTKSSLSKLATFVSKNPDSTYLFGTVDAQALKALMSEDTVGIVKAIGRSEHKVLQFIRLFDDWDSLKGGVPLHYSFQVAIQNRLHVIEQTLNYQQDNFFSRHIMGTSEVQTLTDEDTKYMVAYIADELVGVTPEQVLGQDTHDELTYALSKYTNASTPLNAMFNLDKILSGNKDSDFYGKFKSAWDLANYLRGIRDIRQGLKDGKVTTRFMPEPDGTASGAFITALQAAGRSELAGAVVKRMMSKLSDDQLNDMYQLATEKVEVDIKKFDELRARSKDGKLDALDAAEGGYLGLLTELVEVDKVAPKVRDIIKMPFTTFIYGQKDKNNVVETSNTLADAIISKNDKAIVDKYLAKAKEALTRTGYVEPTNNGEIRDALVQYFSMENGFASNLVALVSNTVGSLFTKQEGQLESVHALLTKAVYSENGYKHTRIVPPHATLSQSNIDDKLTYAELREDFGASIEKAQEVIVDPSNTGKIVSTSKKLPNKTSIKVLLQHMTDAAILMSALEEVLNSPTKIGYQEGLMLIHDAVGASVSFARELEEVYQRKAIEINSNYDFVEAALNELKYARSQVAGSSTDNPKLLAEMAAEIAKLDVEVATSIKLKKEILASGTIDTSFGVKPEMLERVKNLDLRKGSTKSSKETTTEEVVNDSNDPNFNLFFSPKELITDVKDKIQDTMHELAYPTFGEYTDTLDKSSITKLFDVSTEEYTKLQKEYGKKMIDEIEIFLKLYGNTDMLEEVTSEPQYDIESGKLRILTKAIKDPRTGKKVTGYEAKKVAIEMLAHELEHRNTYSYLSSNMQDPDVIKLTQYMDKITENFPTGLSVSQLPEYTKVMRAYYATRGVSMEEAKKNPMHGLGQTKEQTDLRALGEFVAILYSEPAYRDFILKSLPAKEKATIMKTVKRVVNKILEFLKLSRRDSVKNIKEVYPDAATKEIMELVNAIHAKGLSFGNKIQSDSILSNIPKTNPGFIDIMKKDGKKATYVPKSSKETLLETPARIVNELDEKVAKAIQFSIDLSVDTVSNKMKGKTYHDNLMKESSVYRDSINAINNIWETNSFIGHMKKYLNTPQDLSTMSAQAVMAEERKAKVETNMINDLHKKLKGLYSDKEVESLHSLFSEVPIFNLNKNGVLAEILEGNTTVEESIETLLKSSDASKSNVAHAKALAEFYINKKASSEYSHFTTNLPKDVKELVDSLSTLYSIQLVPDSKALLAKSVSSAKHKVATQTLLDLSTAVKNLDDSLLNSIDIKLENQVGNLNQLVFDNNVETRGVTVDTIDKLLKTNLGWKVLIKPTDTVLGVIYRDQGDVTVQSGVGVNYSYNPNMHVRTSDKYANANNNVATNIAGEASLTFTNEQLDTLGLIRDPAISLVKAYTHKMMLKETQSIREEITDKFTYDYANTTEAAIVKDIKEDKHLWYIKMPMGTTFNELDPKIQGKYTLSTASSDLNDFGKNVTYVRNDLKDFVEGYKEIQIGEVGSTLNKAFSVVKKTVLLQKLHWVVVNPLKQAADAVSNTMYLLSRNVPVGTIYRGTKKILPQLAEITSLQNKLLTAEFRNRAEPTEANQARIDRLENKIKNHDLATGIYSGYITSAVAELSGTNTHTQGGVHKDISNLLNKIFKNDKDSLNVAGKLVMGIGKFGPQGENILVGLANKLEKKEGQLSENVVESLREMATHIKDIKDEGDVASYIQEFMATPGSSLVKAGSLTLVIPDITTKVILHNELVMRNVKKFIKSKDRQPNKAELQTINDDVAEDVNNSLLNPSIKIPRQLRLLEQTGITSFVSFWARIQRVIVKSLLNNPVNAATTIIMNELFGSNVETIFNAEIFDRNEIFGTPSFGLDVVLPTKLI